MHHESALAARSDTQPGNISKLYLFQQCHLGKPAGISQDPILGAREDFDTVAGPPSLIQPFLRSFKARGDLRPR